MKTNFLKLEVIIFFQTAMLAERSATVLGFHSCLTLRGLKGGPHVVFLFHWKVEMNENNSQCPTWCPSRTRRSSVR